MSKKKPAPQSEEQKEWRFSGFVLPTTTPVPDQLFDELLHRLSPTEVVTLLYIIRRTFGFKKESDNISINQMLNGITKKDGTKLDGGTGLSKPTLLRSLKSLTEKNIVIAERRKSRKKGHEPTNYKLNLLNPLGKNLNQGVSQNFTKPLVKKFNPQQTVNNKQLDNTVNGNKSLLKDLPDLDQPKEKTEYVAQYILDELGDRHSENFYNLVAAKVPEDVIRRALAEIKQDGAANPVKVFTHRMKLYALEQLKGIS